MLPILHPFPWYTQVELINSEWLLRIYSLYFYISYYFFIQYSMNKNKYLTDQYFFNFHLVKEGDLNKNKLNSKAGNSLTIFLLLCWVTLCPLSILRQEQRIQAGHGLACREKEQQESTLLCNSKYRSSWKDFSKAWVSLFTIHREKDPRIRKWFAQTSKVLPSKAYPEGESLSEKTLSTKLCFAGCQFFHLNKF